MQDALDISDKIVEARDTGISYSDAFRAYETLMIPRATKAVTESRAAWVEMDLSIPEAFRPRFM